MGTHACRVTSTGQETPTAAQNALQAALQVAQSQRGLTLLERLDPNNPGIQEISKQLLGFREWVSLGAFKEMKTGGLAYKLLDGD
jgi:hypothetical protein